MQLVLYIGEAFSQTLDLDTSATEADYSLSGTITFRMAPVGATEAVLATTCTIADATAGTLTLTLSAVQTAALTEGVYGFQVTDSTPLVLASGVVTVLPMMTDPAN